MRLTNLIPFWKATKQPKGIINEERDLSPAETALLYEIRAKLSGIGEPPQLGNRVVLNDIQKAIRMSELGEPYFMYALFRDMIENDAHLSAEIGKRIMSFMGQTETIEPVDPNNPEDVKATEFIEDIIANCENWREGSVHLAQGHIWDISGAEKIFARVEPEDAHKFRHPTQWHLRMLHPIPWPLFTYKVAYWNVSAQGTTPGSGMNMVQNTGTGSTPINNPPSLSTYNPLPPKQSEVFIWNPQDWHPDLRFYGTLDNGMIDWSLSTGYKADKMRHVLHSSKVATSGMKDNFGSILRSMIPLWFYKKSCLDWYMSKMERYGGPFAVGTVPMNNKNVSDAMANAFNQATKINALLVPPAAKVELKEINASGMSDGFAKAIEVLNTEMTKGILGQTLSTSSKGSGMMGGSGVADLHGEVKEEWSLFDKRSYCEMQSQQIFEPILKLNGYKGRCRSVRGGVSASQQALMARTLQSLYLSGIRVKKDEEQKLTNTFGIKLEVFDPQENMGSDGENGDGKSKQKKSLNDHKNPKKGVVP